MCAVKGFEITGFAEDWKCRCLKRLKTERKSLPGWPRICWSSHCCGLCQTGGCNWFWCKSEKIELYRSGVDPTREVGNDAVRNTSMRFTSDEAELKNAKFIIVAVPTPINQDKTPDLAPVIGASEAVGRNLTCGSIVVYESTVYPGVTESICIPILERESGLKCGVDFRLVILPNGSTPATKYTVLKTSSRSFPAWIRIHWPK